MGVMKHANEYLKSKGVKNGDRVSFAPESDYEFRVDGDVLYRTDEDPLPPYNIAGFQFKIPGIKL